MGRALVRTVLGGVLAAGAALAGSGCTPTPVTPPVPTTLAQSSPTRAAPSPTPSPLLPSFDIPTGFPDSYAAACGSYLPVSAIEQVLRTAKVLPSGTAATAVTGPLCAADWQFTEFSVGGMGLVQAITRGNPAALRLVTAGTDVCSPAVRAEAPSGIQAIAHC